MIQKEIYSPNAFLQILNKNNINCKFEKCNLYKDYVTYHFNLEDENLLTEFQIYSVTFSVIIESESSCYFIGKKGKKLIFLMTFTNDLSKYGLKKTPEKLGKIPKESYFFDFVKMPLDKIIWYKFDTKKMLSGNLSNLQEYDESATNAEERVLLDGFWNKISN